MAGAADREARSEAVFASTLQPSDTPTADMIASAISCAVQRLGTRGYAEKMAQENEFQHSRRDPYQKVMAWLLPRAGRP